MMIEFTDIYYKIDRKNFEENFWESKPFKKKNKLDLEIKKYLIEKMAIISTVKYFSKELEKIDLEELLFVMETKLSKKEINRLYVTLMFLMLEIASKFQKNEIRLKTCNSDTVFEPVIMHEEGICLMYQAHVNNSVKNNFLSFYDYFKNDMKYNEKQKIMPYYVERIRI